MRPSARPLPHLLLSLIATILEPFVVNAHNKKGRLMSGHTIQTLAIGVRASHSRIMNFKVRARIKPP